MSKDFVRVLRSIIQHVDDLQNEADPTGNGFTREFRKIREEQNNDKKNDRYPAEEGKKQCNIKKNRYKDIVPYDYTRVVLETATEEETDYINASFVKDADDKNAYIASQGPLPHTVDDFWRMLWQYRIEVVFAACREWEERKHKCQRYWATPEDTKPMVFGNIVVTLEKETEVFEDFYLRTLVAQKGGEVQRVRQFHYCGWPDHGIPDNADHIREIIGYVRNEKRNPNIPIVVHCSAGCGRTGTICAIDYCWTLLKEERYPIDLTMYDIINKFRQQRMSMVQTPDQYELAHLVLQALCQRLLEENDDHNYENYDLPFGNAPPPPNSEEELYYNVHSDIAPNQEEASAYELLVEGERSAFTPRAPQPTPAPKPEEASTYERLVEGGRPVFTPKAPHPTPAPKPVPAPRPQVPEKPEKPPLHQADRNSGLSAAGDAGVKGARVNNVEGGPKSVHKPHALDTGAQSGPSYENVETSYGGENSSSAASQKVEGGRSGKPEQVVTLGRATGAAAAAAVSKPAPATVSQATGKKMLGGAVTVINFTKQGSTIIAAGSAPNYENATVEQQPPPLQPKQQPRPQPQPQPLAQPQQPPSQTSGVAIHMLSRPTPPVSKPPKKATSVPPPAKATPAPVRTSSSDNYFVLEPEEPQQIYSVAKDVGPSPISRMSNTPNQYEEIDESAFYSDVTPNIPKKEKKAPAQSNVALLASAPVSRDPPATAPASSAGPPQLPKRNYTDAEVSDIAATGSKQAQARSPKLHAAPITPMVANSHSGPPARPGAPRRPSNPQNSAAGLQNSNPPLVMTTGPGIFRGVEIGNKRRLARVRNGVRPMPQRWKKL